MVRKVMREIGQMNLISKLKDGKDLQKKIMTDLEINQINVANQDQEIYLDQGEENYRFTNLLIPEEPSKVSKCGLNTSLIIVKGFLFRKNL